MARRTFDVIDICEIFTHWHAGRSKNEIAGSLGLSRNTVRKYVAAAEVAGIVPGGPPVSQERWVELAGEWFPELADTRLRQVTWPAIEAHRDYIVAQLKAGVTMATIHQRLADERGLAASVASLRRYVAANLPEEARRAQVRVLRLDPPEPGQEAQVDYGQLGRWVDPATGRRHVVNAFAMVLCCSRLLFVRPVIKMDQRAWTECHAAAFGFFGGYAGVESRIAPAARARWAPFPSRSVCVLETIAGPAGWCRRATPAHAGTPAGGRLSRVRCRALPSEHATGHGIRPEGVLHCRAEGAGGGRTGGCVRVHHRAAGAAARAPGGPARRWRGGAVSADDQAAVGQHFGAV